MNVMLEKCVIPACLAKSTNDTPYCSEYHQSYDRATSWGYAKKKHYVVLQSFVEGPMFLSPWEKGPDWDDMDSRDRRSPEVCVYSHNDNTGHITDAEEEEEEGEGGEGRSESSCAEDVATCSGSPSHGYMDMDMPALPNEGDEHQVNSNQHLLVQGSFRKFSSNFVPNLRRYEEIAADGEDDDRDRDRINDQEMNSAPLSQCKEIITTTRDGDESDVDDEILEFSQTVREEVPAYFLKTMQMDDSLFNRERRAGHSQRTSFAKNSNRLSLSVHAADRPQGTRDEGRRDSSGEASLLAVSNGQSGHAGGAAVSNSDSSSGLPWSSRRGSGGSSSSVRSEGSRQAVSGLGWDCGRFHRVDLASATKKKRSRQNTLDTFVRQKRR